MRSAPAIGALLGSTTTTTKKKEEKDFDINNEGAILVVVYFGCSHFYAKLFRAALSAYYVCAFLQLHFTIFRRRFGSNFSKETNSRDAKRACALVGSVGMVLLVDHIFLNETGVKWNCHQFRLARREKKIRHVNTCSSIVYLEEIENNRVSGSQWWN